MSQQTSCSWRQVVFHLLPLRLWCWCEKQPPGRLMGLWGPGSAPLGFGGENSMPPVFQQISREQMARIFGNRRPRSRCSHSRSHSPLGSRYYRATAHTVAQRVAIAAPVATWEDGAGEAVAHGVWVGRLGEQGMHFLCTMEMLLCSLLLYMPWLGNAVKNTRRHFHSWHQFVISLCCLLKMSLQLLQNALMCDRTTGAGVLQVNCVPSLKYPLQSLQSSGSYKVLSTNLWKQALQYYEIFWHC